MILRSKKTALNSWKKTLPRSKMVFPSNFKDRLKYGFWYLYTPIHPLIRNLALSCRLVSHGGRQNFLIGIVNPGLSIQSLVEHLVANGYGHHFIAWRDDGEVVSLRRVVDFKYQYHLRIFEDGEVRGHYEYTPECHPFLHYYAVDARDHREEFLNIIKDKIIPQK